MNTMQQHSGLPAILPDPNGRFSPCPTLITEEEVISFLRIPDISSAKNHRHIIENLRCKHDLPRIHLCGKAVYLTDAAKAWWENHHTYGH